MAMTSASKPILKKKKPSDIVWFWGNECRYEVIHDKVIALGWKTIDDERKESRCNLFWIDTATIHERFRSILPWQMINHFPGMPNIARKQRMGQNLNRMQKTYPVFLNKSLPCISRDPFPQKEYSYYPRTWILPGEMSDFRTQFDNQGNALGNKIFIIKPDAGCQGKGISLARTFDQVPQQENVVAQVYIKRPLLIDGYKFDLRIYILVTSVKPLRMYLFQDGLVRLCTEEYVKPTKQNMSQLCMHLTNYAVNKKNDKFQQAATDDDEGGSKRSLDWFMSWIRDEYGETKANWLWKRFGVLAVRTVLSILPTLSREYDLYFKSFNNVPVTAPPNKSKTSSTGERGQVNDKKKKSEKKAKSSQDDEEDDDEGEEEGEEEEEEDSGTDDSQAPRPTVAAAALGAEGDRARECKGDDVTNETSTGQATSSDSADGVPSDDWRGSRCFEILGIDVMVDSHLKPWLIEFNHLPSFGTDSPLDADIKGRLMEEVFSIINVRPDDEQMFALYHKMEAERRLLAERTTASSSKVREKERVEREKKEEADRLGRERWSRRRAEMLREREKEVERQKEIASAAAAARALEIEAAEIREIERQLQMDRLEAQQNMAEPTPVSGDRYQEITRVLGAVYEIYCPNKKNKIDKLLSKYVGREEEFVAFVFDKYAVPYENMVKYRALPELNTSPLLAEIQSPPMMVPDDIQETLVGGSDDGERESLGQEREEADEGALLPSEEGVQEEVMADSNSQQRQQQRGGPQREGRKATRVNEARSASPPNRRANAWKGTPEDEEAFKAEVIATHIPKPGDRWLQFEKERLPSFFRIFPSHEVLSDTGGMSSAKSVTALANEDEEEGDEEEDGEGGDTSAAESDTPSSSKPVAVKKIKTASFEEILCQVFLQDRRQTMRLKVPLGSNRSKSFDRATTGKEAADSQSLPALSEPFRAGSNKSSQSQSARGIPGWRPPPAREKRDLPKQSTQHQIDIANKLSKGLSSLANGEDANGNKPARVSKMIVSAKHRVYSNTASSSGSAAGAVYSHNPQYVYAADVVGGDYAGRGGIAFDNYLEQGSIASIGSVGEGDMYSVMMSNLQQSSALGAVSRQASVNKISAGSAAPLRQQTFAFDNGVAPNLLFGESNAAVGNGKISHNIRR